MSVKNKYVPIALLSYRALSIAEPFLHNCFFKKITVGIFVDAVESSSKEINIQRCAAEIILALLHKLRRVLGFGVFFYRLDYSFTSFTEAIMCCIVLRYFGLGNIFLWSFGKTKLR